jgi:uncharacterized membrane protein (DUF2068 family)
VYHYLAAAFLGLLGCGLFVGGKVLSTLGGAEGIVLPRAGFLIGVVGGTIFLVFALVHLLAGYGVWSMQNWGRVLAIILAVVSLLLALPGLLLTAMMMHVFFGSFRILRIVISVLIVWYLLKPEVKALFGAGRDQRVEARKGV